MNKSFVKDGRPQSLAITFLEEDIWLRKAGGTEWWKGEKNPGCYFFLASIILHSRFSLVSGTGNLVLLTKAMFTTETKS